MSETPPTERSQQQREETSSQQGEKAIQAAIQFPIDQAVNFQKGVAELFLNGLEITNKANKQSLEMTRDLMGNYLQTLDRTAQQSERVAEQNAQLLEDATRSQQQMGEQGLRELGERMEEGVERTRGQFYGSSEQFPPQQASQQQPQSAGQQNQSPGQQPQQSVQQPQQSVQPSQQPGQQAGAQPPQSTGTSTQGQQQPQPGGAPQQPQQEQQFGQQLPPQQESVAEYGQETPAYAQQSPPTQ